MVRLDVDCPVCEVQRLDGQPTTHGPCPHPRRGLRLTERGHTALFLAWLAVAGGLFGAVVVFGSQPWVKAGIVAEAVGTACYLLAAMRA